MRTPRDGRLFLALTPIFLPLLVLCSGAHAQGSPAAGAVLFVASSPMGAAVEVDGKALTDHTPLMLRALAAGRHTVLLCKDGYADVRLAVDLGAGEVRSLEPALTPTGVWLAAVGEADVAGRVERGGALDLPAGTYALGRAGSRVAIDPIYPGDRAITALDCLLPTLAVLSGLSVAQDILYGRGSSHYFSPLTVTTFALTAGTLGVDVALRVGRSRWRRSFQYATRPAATAEAEEAVLGRAELLLEQGALEQAAAAFLHHVELFPDSAALPSSLYQVAKLYQILGEGRLAAATLRLVLTRYPDPAIYDRAAKSLADIQASGLDYAAAIDSLGLMVMIDPLHTREEVDAYRCELLLGWSASETGRAADAVSACRDLIGKWSASARLPEYRYLLAASLRRVGDASGARAALAEARAGADEELLSRIRTLEAEIGGTP